MTTQSTCGGKFLIGMCANHSWSQHWKND